MVAMCRPIGIEVNQVSNYGNHVSANRDRGKPGQ